MALVRVRACVVAALCGSACGFDTSGLGEGAAEIGETSGANDAVGETSGAADGSTTGSASASGESTTSASASASASATDPSSSSDADESSGTSGAGTTGPQEWGPFEPPVPITALNSPAHDDDPTLRGDLLEIVFASDRPPATSEDLLFAFRADTGDEFGVPAPLLGMVNGPYTETAPELATDGLVLTFASDRLGAGNQDLFVTWRVDVGAAWALPTLVSELSSPNHEVALVTTDDGLVGYFCRFVAGPAEQLMRTTRAHPAASWSAPVELRINDVQSDCSPWVHAHGLELWFNSVRAEGQGFSDIWVSQMDKDFGAPVLVEELNSGMADDDPWLSPAGELVVFASNRGGNFDLYWSVRGPL